MDPGALKRLLKLAFKKSFNLSSFFIWLMIVDRTPKPGNSTTNVCFIFTTALPAAFTDYLLVLLAK